MKKVLPLVIIFLYGCGPELQTLTQRDAYNRIILEGERKGDADTLWTNIYTYHPQLDNKESVDSTIVEDVSINADGGLTWGEEPSDLEPDTFKTLDSLATSDTLLIPAHIDTSKQSLSTYTKQRPNGEWKTWYRSGQLASSKFYVKGTLNGVSSFYDSIGILLKTEHYVKDKKTGLTHIFEDGTIKREEISFKKDSINGPWTSWHSNGSRHVIRQYKNGRPLGNWVFTDSTQQWMREEQYKKGLAHGIWSFYDSTGVKEYQYYTMGELMASYSEAKWPNGQIKEVPDFKNGLPHGTWNGYWADGSTRYTAKYKNGEKHGDEIHYDSTGTLRSEVKYTTGKKDGIESVYH
ncbi:MAG: toxin-antitoxin system YwqK family antitoxin [Candidatus Marinimicrobia bacterium]|nr:toxin-antitoxin system YwqK family antitoxin [Candidatus Neomarinimicrobiota bacterium]